MATYTCRESRLRENFPHSIIERDEQGGVAGTYTGYWNANKHRVTLYPDYRHPALKPGTRLQKKSVYDGYVHCSRAEVPAKKPEAAAKSQTSRLRKLPIEGQEKMKF